MCDKCKAAAKSGTVLLSERVVYFGVLGNAFLDTWLDMKIDGSFVLTSSIVQAGYGDGYAQIETGVEFCPLCGARLSEIGKEV